MDALAFHFSKVGDSFQNIPYGKQSTNWGVEKKHVAFIGENGEILEEMKCAPYFLVKESDDLKKYRRDFKFSSDENKLVFALKLTEDHPKSGISNFLLFLSKPMSFKTIQELRHSVYNKEDTGRVNRDLESIELIWK